MTWRGWLLITHGAISLLAALMAPPMTPVIVVVWIALAFAIAAGERDYPRRRPHQ